MVKKKAPERQYIKKGRTATTGLIAVIIVAAVILIIGCAIAVFAANYTVEKVQESAGVSMQINVHGNSLIVEIIGGERVSELKSIHLTIDGVDLTASQAEKIIKPGQRIITYESVAYGIQGTTNVYIRGEFIDGKTAPLKIAEIRFT
ncbi:MAG: hypothetical protein Q4Q53_08545 [Methanocorpusculum sp.]|nr:hypothetical protein [Methanocorpusculum sp.]